MTAVTKPLILKEIGCKHLRLYRDTRSSYFYFVYDHGSIWESLSVYVDRLSSRPLSFWVGRGMSLVAQCEKQEEAANAMRRTFRREQMS